MRRPLTLLLAGLLAGATLPAVALTQHQAAAPERPAVRVGMDRLSATLPNTADLVRGIVELDHVPTSADVSALRGLGLGAQGMGHLPLAIVQGTKAQLLDAVDVAGVLDVYPDDQMQLLWDKSAAAMTADQTQKLGFTGKGVQVAVVDSGIDATHPDLSDHVVHNVKLVSGEYANQPPDPSTPDDPYLVVPVDQGPYNDTDNTSGHGTHVAGIIAADGHTDPSQVGVAPDAELIGYAIGEVLFTTAVITAYDHMLDNPDWGIDVVNNSWGNSFLQFDPKHPINVATKAVADTGVVVVFAAGNSGEGETEMTINPFSTPPWVLSVASGTITKERSSFSSNGLEMDNSMVAAPDADGHVHFDGDRLGQYHPDITAPGSNIISSGTTTVAVGPSEPGGTAEASGTSMATPHVAGAAAVLLSAKPDLSVADVFGALEATAVPLADGSPFWQTGFGYVDLASAVRLVQHGGIDGQLAADRARLMAARSWKVQSSDLWTWDALPVTVGGADTRTIEVTIGKVDAVKIALAHPSLSTVGVNGFEYDVTVRDASGEVIGTGTESSSAGVVTLLVDKNVKPGKWTVQVDGIIGVADPDTIDSDSVAGTMTTLQVAQLRKQTPAGGGTVVAASYHPTGQLAFSLAGDGGATMPLPTPEGCEMEDGAPSGILSPAAPAKDAVCQSGASGWTVSRTADMPATFTSEPLAAGATIGGKAKVVVHVADDAAQLYSAALTGYLAWTLSAVPKEGDAVALGEGQVDAAAGRNEVVLDVPVGTVAPGSRLVLTLAYSASPAGAPTNSARILYGGGDYADAGFWLPTGTIS